MGGTPLKKKKACGKACQPHCPANPKNHIPHEHLIAATSALVMALAGIIMTIPTVEAAVLKKPAKPIIEIACRDTDGGKLTEQAGTAMMVEINTTDKSLKRTALKEDTCLSKRVLREYSCRGGKQIISQQIGCKKGHACHQGACHPVEKIPADTALSTTAPAPAAAPTDKSLVGYCVLSGITGGEFTRLQSPDIGNGFAQINKGQVGRIEDLYAACSNIDFAVLATKYCSIPNQPPYQRNAVTYDSSGMFTGFGGCHAMFGCEYYTCDNKPRPDDLPTPSRTY